MSKGFHHYAVFMGNRPAGIGNEIFNYSKSQIANKAIPGIIHFPKHRMGIHVLPKQFSHTSDATYHLRLILARIKGELLVIDQKVYFETAKKIQKWDYRDVIIELVKTYPKKRHFLHSSKMAGGYLSIKSFRKSISEMFVNQTSVLETKFSVAMHVRGAVEYKTKFYRRNREDFSSSMTQISPGVFNLETPISFYLDVIDHFSKSELEKNYDFKIVTNLKTTHPKIAKIIDILQSLKLNYTVVEGDQVDGLAEIATANLIVPSISSYSLLAIFISDSQFLWPAHHLHGFDHFLSIWGYESEQISRGPTSNNRSLAKNDENLKPENIRGLPFPFSREVDLNKWLASKDQEFPPHTDLIYYGVVPENMLK